MQYPDWLDRLLKRIGKMLGFRPERPTVRILEEYHADGISVFRLDDPSIPGCCDFWRIDKPHDHITFFLCLINVRQLREDLALLRVRPNSLGEDRGRGMVSHVQRQIEEQQHIDASHYWITGWNKTYSGIDKKGRAYQTRRTSDVRVVAVDLQGLAGTFNGDKYAHRFARKVIKQLAANEFREFAHHRTWQAAVKSIDWAGWLSGLMRSKDGIGPEYMLQPLKPNLRKIGDKHRLSN